jgi:hypothetical protein
MTGPGCYRIGIANAATSNHHHRHQNKYPMTTKEIIKCVLSILLAAVLLGIAIHRVASYIP